MSSTLNQQILSSKLERSLISLMLHVKCFHLPPESLCLMLQNPLFKASAIVKVLFPEPSSMCRPSSCQLYQTKGRANGSWC